MDTWAHRAVMPVLIALSCTSCSSSEPEPSAATADWPCPAAAHPWQIGPHEGSESGDGLPQSGSATHQAAEAILGSDRADLLAEYGASDAAVEVQPGRAWVREGDIVDEDIATIVLTIPSADACPDMPSSWNGIPLTFSLGG